MLAVLMGHSMKLQKRSIQVIANHYALHSLSILYSHLMKLQLVLL